MDNATIALPVRLNTAIMALKEASDATEDHDEMLRALILNALSFAEKAAAQCKCPDTAPG